MYILIKNIKYNWLTYCLKFLIKYMMYLHLKKEFNERLSVEWYVFYYHDAKLGFFFNKALQEILA